MAFIGNIEVPEITPTGTFPLVPDHGWGRVHAPQVVEHQFGSGNEKITQRYLLGNGAKRFPVRVGHMTRAERDSLRDFWELRKGPYGAFTYNYPNESGSGTTAFTVRFAAEPLSFEHMAGLLCSTGLTLIEIPTSSPTYTVNATLQRFPSGTLETALLSQVQELIPLLKITVREAGYPVIYLSDRMCTLGSQLYVPRLLDIPDGISQSMGGDADLASFLFGNADRVMRDLANDTDLWRADVEFSLFHVGTGIKLDFWKGIVYDWEGGEGPEFRIQAADFLYDLRLSYPIRDISRTCWKDFDDGVNCPYTAEGNGGGATSCNKSFSDCTARGMTDYHGGIPAKPQGVQFKDNASGTWGIGRRLVTSLSLVNDSIYGQPLQEIYTDSAMPVNCQIAAGREEGDFYRALGIVGAGPISSYGANQQHVLDGQNNHGPGSFGLRRSHGSDPATDNNPDPSSDLFSLNAEGTERAAGVAFVEILRTDAKGLQLSRPTDHQMQVQVTGGLSGWVWHDVSTRASNAPMVNPVWISVNTLLRGLGLHNADAATQATVFDVQSAIDAAAICDLSVTKIIGSGSETQFKYRGVIADPKPLRDWIQEILTNCLGYYTFAFGKVKFGIRVNSSAVEAFTAGNILLGSLSLAPRRPEFNDITGTFADEEYEYAANTVRLYDETHRQTYGRTTGTLNLAGSSSKSQVSRIITTSLREQIGGTSAEQWAAARRIGLKTTALALSVEPGMVCSLTHAEMPGGAGEFRVVRWRLNRDYSIDIEGTSTTDSMYDLTAGPKPADVVADPVPSEFPAIAPQIWHPYSEFPTAGDPLRDTDEGTFELTQDYTASAAGSIIATLFVEGKLPVNSFIANPLRVMISNITTAATGGSILGGHTYWIAVCARDADGKYTPPSNIASIVVPSGTNTNTISFDVDWPAGTYDGYTVFGSNWEIGLCSQVEATAALPASITLASAFFHSTWSMPNPRFGHLRVKAKQVLHAGVVGARVTSVTGSVITVSDLVGPSDDWTGRDVSVIADFTDGSAAVWNFNVSSYDDSTGALTVTPTPSLVQPGDVIIIRAHANISSADTIGDSKLVNQLAPSGLNPDEEIGYLIRIIAGKGRYQPPRRIVSHTATTYTVDPPWDVVPDSTSRFIVEFPAWQYFAESSPTSNALPSVATEIRATIDNLKDKVALVLVTAVDIDGYEASEDYSPYREIYLFGETFIIVRDTILITAADSPYAMAAKSQRIDVDTTAGDVELIAPLQADMVGRSATVKRISGGANACTITMQSGDDMDGSTSVSLPDQWDSVTFEG